MPVIILYNNRDLHNYEHEGEMIKRNWHTNWVDPIDAVAMGWMSAVA